MTDTMRKLDEAYQRLMTIPVAGVNVQPMAEALSLLRSVYIELNERKDGETHEQSN